ncbi:MAG: hypothetical protein RRB13_00245 [bacterium]|nr:hypothetical protein [bacterium]
MRTSILAIVGFLFLALAMAGCKEGITSHNIDLDGAEHGKKLYQGAKDCTACHGITLKGNGWIPGCYDCHGVMWDKSEHQINKSGVMHKHGYFSAKNNCSECHGGTALTGKRSRPSCYSCHGDKWTALESHTELKGSYYHATGLYTPESSCTECHGSDLKGGSTTEPSCYECHGARWLYSSYPHNDSEDGVMHGSGKNNPYTNCVSCHGASLTGDATTGAPSCYRCHGAEWADGDNDNLAPAK